MQLPMRREVSRAASAQSAEGKEPDAEQTGIEDASASASAVGQGLEMWRSRQLSSPLKTRTAAPRLPVIPFPLTDLLLIGQTKRMHLFEPRWIDMVDTVLKELGGIFGLLYFAGDNNVLSVATAVEIISCGNLGEAGRMVTVRGVGRMHVKGLSKEVGSMHAWGAAEVEEVEELRMEDNPCDDKGGATDVAAKLTGLIVNLNLGMPQPISKAVSQAESAGEAKAIGQAVGDDIDSVDEADMDGTTTPELWTHERTNGREDFAALAGSSWVERCEAVRSSICDVPVCRAGGFVSSSSSSSSSTSSPSASMSSSSDPGLEAQEEALVVLYAALGGAGLRTRVDDFLDTERSVSARLGALTEQMKERQGMASARRALAGIFSGDGDAGEDKQVSNNGM